MRHYQKQRGLFQAILCGAGEVPFSPVFTIFSDKTGGGVTVSSSLPSCKRQQRQEVDESLPSP